MFNKHNDFITNLINYKLTFVKYTFQLIHIHLLIGFNVNLSGSLM